jgi:hypothetical protein
MGERRKEKGTTKEKGERKNKERSQHLKKKKYRERKSTFSETIIIHSCLERRNRHKLKCIIAVST